MDSIFIPVNPRPGSTLPEVATECIELAKRLGISVQFKFNGVLFYVSGKTTVERILRKWEEFTDN